MKKTGMPEEGMNRRGGAFLARFVSECSARSAQSAVPASFTSACFASACLASARLVASVSFACSRPLYASRIGHALVKIALCALLCVAMCFLAGCGGSGSSSGGATGDAASSGSASAEGGGGFDVPEVRTANFDESAAEQGSDCAIDTSHTSEGYVGASATIDGKLKFQVLSGEMSYNYDLPSDGTPIICPLNMGDGSYTLRVMQNTSGSNYVEVFSTTADVSLDSEFAPYLCPNVFCDFSASSSCVAKAQELAASAADEVEAMDAIYSWITSNVRYDSNKAQELQSSTGYVPNPDDTFKSKSGICFDYASLGAAMLRSIGIPCKILTGYVAPDGIYHAWNMVYLNGSWESAHISVDAQTWSRVDLTFAAAGDLDTVGDGSAYTDRYTY